MKKYLWVTIIAAFIGFCNTIHAQSPSWLWAKSAGGASDDEALSMCTDANGNVLVTGYFSSSSITFGTSTLTNHGSYNVFIVKYDPSGNLLWAKSAGGTGDDEGLSVNADASGNVFVTGYFSSSRV